MQETCSLLARFGSTELQIRVSKCLILLLEAVEQCPRDRKVSKAEPREKGESEREGK